MPDLLVGHELDQRPVLGEETVLLKLGHRESRESVVEQVKLNPLLQI